MVQHILCVRRSDLDPRPGNGKFVMEKMSPKEGCPKILRYSPVCIFYKHSYSRFFLLRTLHNLSKW